MTALDARWFYVIHGQRVGPVSFEEMLRLSGTGELCSVDLVWRPGMARWEAAGDVVGLFAPPPLPGEEDRATHGNEALANSTALAGKQAEASEDVAVGDQAEVSEQETVREPEHEIGVEDEAEAVARPSDQRESSFGNQVESGRQDADPERGEVSQPIGISGWLIGPAIGLVLSPAVAIVEMVQSYELLPLAPEVTDWWIGTVLLLDAAMAAATIYVAILFFQRRYDTVRAMIYLLSAKFATAIIGSILILKVFGDLDPEPVNDFETLRLRI